MSASGLKVLYWSFMGIGLNVVLLEGEACWVNLNIVLFNLKRMRLDLSYRTLWLRWDAVNVVFSRWSQRQSALLQHCFHFKCHTTFAVIWRGGWRPRGLEASHILALKCVPASASPFRLISISVCKVVCALTRWYTNRDGVRLPARRSVAAAAGHPRVLFVVIKLRRSAGVVTR